MNKLAKLCLLAWIFGIFAQSCIATDDDQRPPEYLCLASRPLLEERLRENQSSDVVNPDVVKEEESHRAVNQPAAADAAPVVVDRPLVSGIVIPDITRGYEDVYLRFLGGALIYKKGQPGEVKLPIAALANPLEGVFDLSRCGDSGQHLSISTGYRKGKKAENTNKVEIWLAPRFLIERNLATTAAHFQPIMNDWNAASAPAGVFWDWGSWDNLGWFDYLITNSFDQLSDNNLYEKSVARRKAGSPFARVPYAHLAHPHRDDHVLFHVGF